MFIDDTILSEVIDITHHLSGNPIGNTHAKKRKQRTAIRKWRENAIERGNYGEISTTS